MKFRTLLGGIVALPLLVAAASANDAAPPRPGIQLPGVFVPLPKVFQRDSAPEGQPMRMAQAGDPRVTQLEEQIRQLSGTIEELNFQILQMQEQMRKMQEDNEFRFQELEGKRSDAGGGAKPRATTQAPRTENTAPPAAGPAPSPRRRQTRRWRAARPPRLLPAAKRPSAPSPSTATAMSPAAASATAR